MYKALEKVRKFITEVMKNYEVKKPREPSFREMHIYTYPL